MYICMHAALAKVHMPIVRRWQIDRVTCVTFVGLFPRSLYCFVGVRSEQKIYAACTSRPVCLLVNYRPGTCSKHVIFDMFHDAVLCVPAALCMSLKGLLCSLITV